MAHYFQAVQKIENIWYSSKRALKDYEEVMAIKALPKFVSHILNYQKTKIKEAIKDLKSLRKAYRKMEKATA